MTVLTTLVGYIDVSDGCNGMLVAKCVCNKFEMLVTG